MGLNLRKTMRKKGDKNRKPSKADILKLSTETIILSLQYFRKHLKTEELTDYQITEVKLIIEKMQSVLNGTR